MSLPDETSVFCCVTDLLARTGEVQDKHPPAAHAYLVRLRSSLDGFPSTPSSVADPRLALLRIHVRLDGAPSFNSDTKTVHPSATAMPSSCAVRMKGTTAAGASPSTAQRP